MANFVLLGNVDNGKSTLAGRIIMQTGNIDPNEIERAKREAEKNNKSSFWLAYLLDVDENERNRGITLGYTFFDIKYKDRDFKIIDVPGHHNLVQEMVSGASNANVAVLVLSARTGEYESSLKGQALQHTLIARGIGIQHLIVAINKIDTIDESSLHKTINFIQQDFTDRVKKFRFKTLKFIPLSAYEGINIIDLMDAIYDIKIDLSKDKYYDINDNKIIKTKFMFDSIPNLISPGFRCIAHSKDEYFPVEIISINNDKIGFVTNSNKNDKNNMPKLIDVEIKILDDKIDKVFSNLVVRYQDVTIGLARVIS